MNRVIDKVNRVIDEVKRVVDDVKRVIDKVNWVIDKVHYLSIYMLISYLLNRVGIFIFSGDEIQKLGNSLLISCGIRELKHKDNLFLCDHIVKYMILLPADLS